MKNLVSIFAFVALLGACACAPPPKDESVKNNQSAPKSDPLALSSCHADGLQHLVGQDRKVLQTMRFGVQVRFEEPGMMYTADYIETRLRIQIGEDGKIKRVFCG